MYKIYLPYITPILQTAHTGSGIDPASYSMDTKSFFCRS